MSVPPARPMLRTLSIVISVALADAVNASTIGPALVLASGEHPRRSVLKFAVGVIAVFFLGGALIVLGPGRALHALEPHPSPTLRYIVETVVGLVMLVVAALLGARQRTLTRHARQGRGEAGGESEHSDHQRPDNGEQDEDESDRSQGDGPRTQRRSPFVMGAIVGAVELPTAFPYFGAIAAIVSSRLGLARELLLVAVYDVCFVLPLFGIILVLTVGGEGATERLARIRTQFQAHWPALASGAALVAGVYVTVLGVTGLASGASGHAGRVSRRIRHVISK